MKDKIKQLAKETGLSENVVAESYMNSKKYNKPLRLNLQHFADPDNTDNPEDTSEDKQEDKTDKHDLTDEELQKKIEAESDRKLQSALEKKQKEWEAETDKRIQDALAERDRLSKLSEKERKEEEMTKKEQELAEREAEIERKILRSDAVDTLQEKDLPSDFADVLLGEDAESTLENINNFKKAFDEAVNNAVKEKLRQDTPPSGTSAGRNSGVPSVAELAQKHRLIK